MRSFRAILILGVAAALPACGSPGGQHEALPATTSSAPVSETDAPSVPVGSSPPMGLVWNVGFTENVPLSAMQAQLPKFIQLSQDLWTITEGQVFLSRVRFTDNVAPGAEASASESLRVPNLDVVIYAAARWNVAPVTGEALFFSPSGTLGRTNRRIDVPDNAARLTLIHEGSHFAWQLSWTGNHLPPGLDDEYVYSPDDPACVMDLMFLPLRWCSGGSLPSPNHVTKNGGQGAESCWEQIRKDYPAFSYSGTNTTPSATPPLAVEFNDTP
jgi:hypothetical protein